ncbi:hypothetical protein H310_02795 [Aphanomyces invadans]|uniref:Uncharacterized protein n=1 Tax=Aphanomyces invadans TaxID=157072 RepID=A0A024UL42_9STRA|nr:hypothetical protein H310_02795 [Aphanomyces invadans]ETW06577.1 hypothetical protein H310_02795 [Aphanomyces invadans]|eukprot:XP_008864652.1 hypothetical protein H310_02795 [Aphanomyces invadans]
MDETSFSPSKTCKKVVVHRGSRNVYVEETTTSSHVTIVACVGADGTKPPNSPDLNVLDLGFFASIEALQYKMVSSSIDDVIFSTLTAFDHLSVDKLENVFLSLQAVMRLVLEHQGDNHFKLPHLRKDALRRAGNLMATVACPVFLLHESDMYLQPHGIPSLE